MFDVSLDWKIIRNEGNPCITMNHLEIETLQSEKRPHGVAFVRLKVHPSFLRPYCRHAPALWQFSTSSMSLMARAHIHAHPPKCLREGRRLLPFVEWCHPHSSERWAPQPCLPRCYRQDQPCFTKFCRCFFAWRSDAQDCKPGHFSTTKGSKSFPNVCNCFTPRQQRSTSPPQ